MSTDATPPRSRWRATVPWVMLFAGLLFGTSSAWAGGDSEPASLAELVQERSERVSDLSDRSSELEQQVNDLTDQRSPLRETTEEAGGLSDDLGLSAVAGPAVEVQLNDAGYTLDSIPEGYSADDVVVHEQDVQGVVNALWAGGAEAMMVQDQRITAASAVQCVGNTLYLHGRVYSPPYVITAIGDTDALSASLEGDATVENYRSWADLLGLGYETEVLEEAELPAYSTSLSVNQSQAIDRREASVQEDGPGER